MIVTEAQRMQAYQRAISNYATTIMQTAPTARQMAQAVSATPKDHPPHGMKHELLAMLQARSNSGTVRLRDVSRVFDELVRDSRSPRR